MPRGSAPGERRGGRAKGAPNKRTSKLAAQAMAEGVTMADIMVGAARAMWKAAHDAKGKIIDMAMVESAGEMAVKAAPYFHPRLASVAHTGKDGGPIALDLGTLTDEQIGALEPVLAALVRSGGAPGATTH